jgi:membrane protein implicated in regulation of membrane protease activity
VPHLDVPGAVYGKLFVSLQVVRGERAMDAYWWWTIAGIALVIAELISGTFYLLVLGLAALAGAGVAIMNYPFWIQALVASAIAIVGAGAVTRFRKAHAATPSVSLDVGQTVVLEQWVDEQHRLARVRYRNAMWDAKVLDEGVAAGRTLYINSVDGNTLHVSAVRPA